MTYTIATKYRISNYFQFESTLICSTGALVNSPANLACTSLNTSVLHLWQIGYHFSPFDKAAHNKSNARNIRFIRK